VSLNPRHRRAGAGLPGGFHSCLSLYLVRGDHFSLGRSAPDASQKKGRSEDQPWKFL